MKKIITIMLLLAVCAGIIGCTKGEPTPNGYKKISLEAADYVLYVPDEWTADVETGVTAAYASDRSNISFMGFEANSALIYLNIKERTDDGLGTDTGAVTEAPVTTEADTAETDETTAEKHVPSDPDDILSAEDFWIYYEGMFEEYFDKMEYAEKGVNILVSGIQSKKYVYTAEVLGAKYKYLQTVTYLNGEIYLFTYTSSEEHFDSHLEDVEAIISFIKIK